MPTAERPLILTAEEARSFLDGRRTEIRRVVVPQPQWRYPANSSRRAVVHYGRGYKRFVATVGFGGACEQHVFGEFRHGVPGDRLWVREPVHICPRDDDGAPLMDPAVWYDADGPPPEGYPFRRLAQSMPRWACRLRLELVSVRVERLCEITESGVLAEGGRKDSMGYWKMSPSFGVECDFWRDAFKVSWDRRHGTGAFQANPWVWVASLRVAEGRHGTDSPDSSVRQKATNKATV